MSPDQMIRGMLVFFFVYSSFTLYVWTVKELTYSIYGMHTPLLNDIKANDIGFDHYAKIGLNFASVGA